MYFFHTKWYYVNNCPLKWAPGRFFPWLLMRWLSPCILTWKSRWVTTAAVHTLKTAGLWLLRCTSGEKESFAWDSFWMRFFRNRSWTFVSFSLKTASFLLSRQKSTFSVRRPLTHHLPPSSRLLSFSQWHLHALSVLTSPCRSEAEMKCGFSFRGFSEQ